MVPALFLLGVLFVHKKLSFLTCLLWASGAFGLRVFDFSLSLVRSSGVASWLVLPLFLALTLYLALQVALILYLFSHLAFWSRRAWKSFRVFVFLLFLLGVHAFLVQGLFWAFGRWEGDITAHPLVPWIVGCAPLLRGSHPPPFLNRIGIVRLPFQPFAAVSCQDQLAHLSRQLHALKRTKPAADIIFTPESALPFCVNEHASTLAALALLSRDKQLVLSGHRSVGEREYSSVYWFSDGVLRRLYDKQHLVFFIERAPELFGLQLPAFIGDLCGGCGYFEPGLAKPEPFSITAECSWHPLICSELFFTDSCAHGSCPDSFFALVNDAWYAGSSQPDLLWAAAFLKSWWYGCKLLYVSYAYATYFDGAGKWYSI